MATIVSTSSNSNQETIFEETQFFSDWMAEKKRKVLAILFHCAGFVGK